MFNNFLENLYNEAGKIPFDHIVWGAVGSFAAVYAACLILTLSVDRFRRLSKRPFLCLVNAYAALTLALFLIENDFTRSVFIAVIFWVGGYLLYGTLCLASAPRRARRAPPPAVMLSAQPVQLVQPPKSATVRAEYPAARNNVRLEHAVSVTDKLLEKNLGKGDRQELEKLKNTLAVLQIKGSLSAAESEILNENFNTLLKLMAKYNV